MTPLPEPNALRDPRTGLGIYFTEDQMDAYGKAEYERGLLAAMNATLAFAKLVAGVEREEILQMSRDKWFKTQADFEAAIAARWKHD